MSYNNIDDDEQQRLPQCMKNGLDATMKDKNGWTGLHYAIKNGQLNIVECTTKVCYAVNIETKKKQAW
jgi:ankyrin repeat protein